MKYILTSARRNFQQNPVVDKNKEMKKYWLEDKQYIIPTYFVSYTNLLKLGINPVNRYGTPLGIYTYPLRYMYSNITHNDVPFAGDRLYIQVVKRTTEKVLYDLHYKNSDYQKDIKKLCQLFLDNDITSKSIQFANDKLKSYKVKEQLPAPDILSWDNVVIVSNTLATMSSKENGWSHIRPIQKIWCLTQLLSYLLQSNSKSTTKWNWLLRYLGYELVIDRNLGMVHSEEPSQAVFLTKSALEHIATVDNKRHKTINDNRPKYLRKFSNVSEEEYNKLVALNPTVQNIQGTRLNIKISNDNRIIISRGVLFKCSGVLRDMVIRINVTNCTLQNCQLEKDIEIIGCTVKDSTVKDALLVRCNVESSSVNFSSSYVSVYQNCEIRNVRCWPDSGKNEAVVPNKMYNCTIISGRFEDTVFSNCRFMDRKRCVFGNNCKFE